MRNERGGKKSTSDDTRIIVELSYKNKILGRVGLYAIIDDKKEGFRIVWDEEGKGYDPDKKPLLELEQDKKQCGECKYNKDEVILGCGLHYREAQKGKDLKGVCEVCGGKNTCEQDRFCRDIPN